MKSKKNYSKNVVQKNSYKFRFNKYVHLGTPDAETDNNLDRVFIDTGACDVLCDITNPKCIIVGRTGSGKSALIRRIEENTGKCRRIVSSPLFSSTVS